MRRTSTGMTICAAASLAVGLFILAPRVHAFDLTGIGGRLSFLDPESGDGTVMGGGHLEFEQRHSQWHLQPSVLFWKSQGVQDVNPNFDVYYHFEREGYVTPYLGGGLGVHAYSYDYPVVVRQGNVVEVHDSNTDLGANMFGGLRFPMTSGYVFLEGRYVATDNSQIAAVGGLTFRLH